MAIDFAHLTADQRRARRAITEALKHHLRQVLVSHEAGIRETWEILAFLFEEVTADRRAKGCPIEGDLETFGRMVRAEIAKHEGDAHA